MPGGLNITVLRGGPGSEREVSLQSGAAVARALRSVGHKVFEADITPDDLSALDYPADVIFGVLHGEFGEDGQLQAILEQRSLRFVGSDAAASRLTIDKHAAKLCVAQAGVQTPQEVFFPANEYTDTASDRLNAQIDQAIARLKLPLVIKPGCEGSSVGVVITRDADQVYQATHECLKNYGDCLLEQFIAGRELTVGILGQMPLPVLEIKPAVGFYDYHAKYETDDTSYLFDVGLEITELQEIQADALTAFNALGCRDLARIDFIRDSAGGLWFLEANTIPGFTSHSLLPKAAAHIGISFPELCDRIVRLTLDRPI
ncbi:MAG: D-alanine--D-alanine ligase [Sedimentisphaerales bacterium]|nr:D-alanine--D-alanine ligase [Sedimentisphaerales bacterium]